MAGSASQFVFDPETVEVNKGDKVRLIITSTDVPHGIAIPEYGINEKLPVGKPVTIEFTADKVGTFNSFCSVAFKEKKRTMLMAASFSIGLVIAFAIFGLIAGLLGDFFNSYKIAFAV